jgi:hypothetical protein
VRLSTGCEIPVDAAEPDLLAVVEALYREVTLRRLAFDATAPGDAAPFEDMMLEIRGLVEQMTADERREYLIESLFLASVRYENEQFEAYAARLTSAPGRKKGRGRAAGSTS